MKKFCAGLFLTVAIIFCSQNFAEAFEVDMGIYPTSGIRAYLITDSVKMYEDGFDCTVVHYYKDNPNYLYYHFYQKEDGFYYNNNANSQLLPVSERTGVEFRIYQYVWLGVR